MTEHNALPCFLHKSMVSSCWRWTVADHERAQGSSGTHLPTNLLLEVGEQLQCIAPAEQKQAHVSCPTDAGCLSVRLDNKVLLW
jgi:hypothetical protein